MPIIRAPEIIPTASTRRRPWQIAWRNTPCLFVLWVSNRIDSNHCGITADLSENGAPEYPKFARHLCFKNLLSGPSLTEQSRTMEGR